MSGEFTIRPLTPETWDTFAALVFDGDRAVAWCEFGTLDLIAQAGGGVVEGYPQDTSDGRRVGSSFLYNGTRSLYERAGFTYLRAKGKNHTVMRRTLAPA